MPGPSSAPSLCAGSFWEFPVPQDPRRHRGDSEGTSSQRPPAPCWGVEQGRDANTKIRVFPSVSQRLAPACCRPSARALIWGKNEDFGALCQAPKAEPPSGVNPPSWQNSNPAGTPPVHPGDPRWVVLGQAGSGGSPAEVGAVGAGRDPAPGIGGQRLSPSRASHSVATPGDSAGPGTASPGPPRPSQGGVAWGGDSAQGCCPSAWWEIPRCPSIIPLLLAPATAATDPPRGFQGVQPCPLPRDIPDTPGHPQAPPEPPGPAGTLQTLPWRSPPPTSSVPALPDPSFLRNGGREGTGRVLSFSTFSSQAGAGSPSPRALSGSPPCSLAPTGCSSSSSTRAPRPPKPSLGLAGSWRGGTAMS